MYRQINKIAVLLLLPVVMTEAMLIGYAEEKRKQNKAHTRHHQVLGSHLVLYFFSVKHPLEKLSNYAFT